MLDFWIPHIINFLRLGLSFSFSWSGGLTSTSFKRPELFCMELHNRGWGGGGDDWQAVCPLQGTHPFPCSISPSPPVIQKENNTILAWNAACPIPYILWYGLISCPSHTTLLFTFCSMACNVVSITDIGKVRQAAHKTGSKQTLLQCMYLWIYNILSMHSDSEYHLYL